MPQKGQIHQSIPLPRLSLHVLLPVTHYFFISSCLILRHPSLICSFYRLFLTFRLQENNITPCYWIALRVCVYKCSDSGRQAVAWMWVPVPVSNHAVCFDFPMWTYPCVYTRVNGSGGLGVLASWPPLALTPLPQSTFPCLPHCADLGYCPAQSTLESSTSPSISILITTHTRKHCGVASVQPVNKKRIYKKTSDFIWGK